LKKFLFYLFFLLSFGFLIDIIGKIIVDFERLTKFGWGYIAGKIILLFIFILLTVLLFKKTYGKKEEE
jgi:hypothetical protein